jgi:hypothetical protein
MKEKAGSPAEDKRASFRIDDSLPVVVMKIEDWDGPTAPDPKTGSGEMSGAPLPEEGVSPSLWNLLVGLHKKLDLILERLPVDLMTTAFQPVNLSAGGMRLKVKKKFDPADLVKLKMLLPTSPVREIFLTGEVVRVDFQGDGQYETALRFLDLDEDVHEEIIQYTLRQQRKAVLAQKRVGGSEK